MRWKSAVLAAALGILYGCAGGPAGTKVESGLLRSVPSRSIEVLHFQNLGKALGMLLDSTHVFSRIDYGSLKGAQMVLSYEHSAGLVPLLAIDAGRAGKDTSGAVRSVLEQASSLKLHSAYSVDSSSRRATLLLSPSEASVSESLSHIAAGTSVMDAPGFAAAQHLSSGQGSIFLKCSAAPRWVPRSFLEGVVARKELLSFVSGACEWAVINFAEATRGSSATLVPTSADKPVYFLSMFEGLPQGESRIGEILPQGASWVVDIPLDSWQEFYSRRRQYLDANSVLMAHDAVCSQMGKSFGMSPENYIKSLNPKEISLIEWEGRRVLAVRSGAKRQESGREFGCPGVFAQMFGKVFSLADESACATEGKWLIVGSAEDLAAFSEAPRGSETSFYGGLFNVYCADRFLVQGGGQIKINVY